MSICNFRQGDSKWFDITVKDGNKNIVDISTGYIITYLMKSDTSVADSTGLPVVLGPVTATVTDGPNGLARINVSAEDTDQLEPVKYYYEFRIQNTNVTPNTVTTLDYGSVKVLPAYSVS
jgi:hypothetical protein